MSVLFEVTERSTAWLTVSFYSRAGVLEVPTSATYEIWDVASGAVVKASASLTPGSSIEITLSSDDNRILNQELFREARKVVVVAAYAGSEKLVQDYVYHVRNIAYRTT